MEQLSPYRLHRVRQFAELVNVAAGRSLTLRAYRGDLRTTLLFEPLAAELRSEIALFDAPDKQLAAMAAQAPAKTPPARAAKV